MSKYIFECDRPTAKLLIATGNDKVGDLMFEPGDMKPEAKGPKDRFGEVNVDSEGVARVMGGLTPDQIAERVIGSDSYKRRAVGKRGIWLKDDRRSAADKAHKAEVKADAFKELDADTLKSILAGKGVAVPVECDHAALVSLAVQTFSDDAPKAPAKAPKGGKAKNAEPKE